MANIRHIVRTETFLGAIGDVIVACCALATAVVSAGASVWLYTYIPRALPLEDFDAFMLVYLQLALGLGAVVILYVAITRAIRAVRHLRGAPREPGLGVA
jgi:hypothetical protein